MKGQDHVETCLLQVVFWSQFCTLSEGNEGMLFGFTEKNICIAVMRHTFELANQVDKR